MDRKDFKYELRPQFRSQSGKFPEKSLWQPRSRKTWDFYCPVCSTHRSLPYVPRPGLPLHYLQIGLTSVVLMLLSWNWLGWKGALWFLPLWTAFEFFYRIRSRAHLVCRSCGFDPVLFLTDEKKAKEEIRAHFEKAAPLHPSQEAKVQEKASVSENRL